MKSHQKWDAKSFYELINDEMDNLANTLHTDHDWKAWKTSQNFERTFAELKICKIKIMGHVGNALQRAFTTCRLMEKLQKNEGWEMQI